MSKLKYMMKKIYNLLLSLSISLCALAQPIQKGPYTISVLTNDVYGIEDANNSNPAGSHKDKDGKVIGVNNCSNLYLVVGKEKALLIDLSNAVKWDSTANKSLSSIVYERVGNKKLFITVTHKHGDHLGMLPAFHNDPKASFWIPEAEFKGMTIFPKERTTYFAENESLDLGGGFIINTMEVPGHTEHSTLFFMKDKNVVFSGDALGSGDGVWLFTYDSFLTYIKAIKNLIKYIENPANNIDRKKLVIYGGHDWQRPNPEKLTAQYVYDMQTLIERMGLGIAEAEAMSSPRGFLDTNFKFGTAVITWNKASEAKYVESIRAK
jgi:glyoxylase-like metal-dependent hydrolase (beta-lactamase superfamily II)